MLTFGQLLRKYRHQCWDSHRDRPLSQERLGELLGIELGDAGYSGAAISDWERDRSKIHEDNRPVLVALAAILHQQEGLTTPEEANDLLRAGNYRALDMGEVGQIFPDLSGTKENGESVGQEAKPVIPPEQTGIKSLQRSAPITGERCKQLVLLKKVQRFWVEGVLEKSIHDVALIDLDWEWVDAVIAHPWQETVGPAAYPDRISNQETSTLEIFQDCDRALLVLGEPGAGKTTTLIGLAQDLINLTEANPVAPIPVILNLVSWAGQRSGLVDWVVEELTAKYLIPRQTGRQWLEADDLILLLDGFDEVPERYRPECAQTINHFRENHGLVGIVVCSRTEEYTTASVRLKLGGAIMLQPLTPLQIDGYLAATPELATLRTTIKRDTTLLDMARSPLMLNIMRLAYGDIRHNVTDALVGFTDGLGNAPINRRRRLFDAYVGHMFQRRVADTRYTPHQTMRWLAWLARRMFQSNRSPFLIEQIQPSWLPGRRWRWAYMLVTGLNVGLVAGLIVWLLLQQLRQTTPQLSADIAGQMAGVLAIPTSQAEILILLVANLLLGLVVAVLQGLYFEGYYLRREKPAQQSQLFFRHVVTVGLVVAALTMVTAGLFGQPTLALGWAIIEAVIFMIAARYVYGHDYGHEIKTVEVLSWSWSRAFSGLVLGLILAVVFEVIGWLLFGQLAVRWTVVVPGVAGLILGGLRGRRVESTSVPNQGILLSFRNSLVAGSLSGLALAILGWTLIQPAYGLFTGLLVFLVVGSISGGGNVFKHLLVRALLWLHGDIPWRYARFLDHAAGLIFLRKVGGGYIFIHPLFQQYFASLISPTEKPRTLPTGYSFEPKHVGT